MLPPYVVLNDPECPNTEVLRSPAEAFTFPLSKEDIDLINTLVHKYDQEGNCAGLAAPQIGIGKRVIVFEVPDDPALKKWRPDLEETMPKTIWLNPSYEAVTEEFQEDYEGCFSVANLAGPVKRHKKIRYKAYNQDGSLIEGTATGFLARVIQHEIDHLNGKLCIDYVAPDELLTIDEYRKRRAAAMEKV